MASRFLQIETHSSRPRNRVIYSSRGLLAALVVLLALSWVGQRDGEMRRRQSENADLPQHFFPARHVDAGHASRIRAVPQEILGRRGGFAKLVPRRDRLLIGPDDGENSDDDRLRWNGGVLGLMAIRHSIVVYPSVENCAVIQPLGYCGLPDGCHAAIYINSDMITADVPNTAIREPSG